MPPCYGDSQSYATPNAIQSIKSGDQVSGNVAAILPKYPFETRCFISHVNGKPDAFAYKVSTLALKRTLKETALIVYLHALGANFLEPFTGQPGNSIADRLLAGVNGVLLSTNYGGMASWGNDEAIEDINENVRAMLKEFSANRILLVGSSMGSCVALNYAATAPADIKEKIKGVLAVEPSGDLKELYELSQDPPIAPSLELAFGGTPDQVPNVYARKSFLQNIDALHKDVRICVISATEDQTIPPSLQFKLMQALEHKGTANKLLQMPGKHRYPPVELYSEGFDFLLNVTNVAIPVPCPS